MVRSGDLAVIGTRSATLTVDRDGRVRGRYAGSIAVSVTQDHLVLWGDVRAQVLDRAGAEVTSWELPALSLAQQTRPAVVQPAGVLLFGLTWALEGWAGQDRFR